MKKLNIVLVIFNVLLFCNLSLASSADPEVVKNVDLSKYIGTWYEIGHNPNFFQKLCDRSTAQYSLNSEGKIEVLNSCYRNDKVFNTIKGTAYAPNSVEPTKLIVDFGFFRKGDYWIIGLDQDYKWAVVSGPKKESLFILSRTAPMDDATLKMILESLKKQGFDISKIIFDKY